jgi:hypothetical protein
MFLILVAVLLKYSESQLVVDLSLPSGKNYVELYSASFEHYNNAAYQKAQYYLELALADKRFSKCFY